MIVCLCRAVSDRDVKAAIHSGARCVDSVAECCGAGTGCGSCHDQIEDLIARTGVAESAHTRGSSTNNTELSR